ncbi:DUF1772 domain-containing protein [Dactylosporangium sp. AC04546]|uniref:DUF1772 domain-containing protein n=1 Tax=Dactylosporangium sp. AC04546 TaxID=2862460 RepID=UPI001EDE1734|nr:DUF1772 domain-containing protein [Dactylosporangium sp. AC04546]WVK79072.1 DUF1772 domain-containing protein [Dactylosporangium sp. AC04546]
MWDKTATVAIVVGSGITAGVLCCVALSLVPAFAALPPGEYVRAHRLFGRYFDRVMPPLVVATTVVAAVTAALRWGGPTGSAAAACAGCLFGVSLVSQFGNVPINRRVKRLDPGAITAAWRDERPAWRRWHLARTGLSLLALLLAALAAVHL